MRCFLAWTPAPPELDALEALRERLRAERDAPGYRWTPRDQLHVTLRFLGEIDAAQRDAIAAALAPLARSRRAFDACVAGWQYLPNRKAPRVLVLRIESRGLLEALAAELESAARDAGLAPERRPFLAHLTLARISFLEELPGPFVAPPEPVELRIDHVALVQSNLAGEGERYATLAREPLPVA